MKRLFLSLLLILFITSLACAGAIIPPPKFQALDANGDPLSGGKVYTYEAGTSTNKATYSDKALGSPNANPVVLDSRGEADIYGSGSYKFVLKTGADVTIWTVDNVRGFGGTDFVTIADYGGDLDAAIVDIGATEKTVYIDQAATLSENKTVPVTLSIVVLKGGSINQSTYSLTFNDSPDAFKANPEQHVFTGTGTISFTLPGKVYAEWWGIDGTADETEINHAFASLLGGGTVIGGDAYVVAAAITPANNTNFIAASRYCEIDSSSFTGSTITIEDKHDVLIQGMKITGTNNAADTNQRLIYVYSNAAACYNVTVKDNFLYQSGRNGISVVSMNSNEGYNIKVLENHCESNQLNGIYYAAKQGIISKNHSRLNGVSTTTGYGIYVDDAYIQTGIGDLTISDNVCYQNQGGGIGLAGIENSTITGNVCDDNGAGIVGVYHNHGICCLLAINAPYYNPCDNLTITGNTCTRNYWNGMFLSGLANSNVSNNTILDNCHGGASGYDGIQLKGYSGTYMGEGNGFSSNICKRIDTVNSDQEYGLSTVLSGGHPERNVFTGNITEGNATGHISLSSADEKGNYVVNHYYDSATASTSFLYSGGGTDVGGFSIRTKTTHLTSLGASATWTNAIPAGVLVIGMSARVTTAIVCADAGDEWSCGVVGNTDLFFGNVSTDVNTTADLANHNDGGLPVVYTSATHVSCYDESGGGFTGGAVKLTLTFIELVPPAS